MAYVTFENLPVYASPPNNAGNDAISDTNQRKVSATQVQFNYAPAISNTPFLGKQSNKDNLLPAGPPDVTISFSRELMFSCVCTMCIYRDYQHTRLIDKHALSLRITAAHRATSTS